MMLSLLARSYGYLGYNLHYSTFTKIAHPIGSIPTTSTINNSNNMSDTPSDPTILSSSSVIGLEPFVYKQFDGKKTANPIPMDKYVFLEKLREILASGSGYKFADGYAEFCKHIFVKNFTTAKLGLLEITPENQHLLKSDYLRRIGKELPVLTRWFPYEKVKDMDKEAEYLDVILYSRVQIEKERTALGERMSKIQPADFYIVSVIPLNRMEERPMMPITIMRNAIMAEGGSGVPIDREAYMKSVEFWSRHAIITGN